MSDTLNQLWQVLEARKRDADPSQSYVAKLHHQGLDKILEKVGEEAFETVIAAKNHKSEPDKLVYEMADLWFHSLVLLSHTECTVDQVLEELARRFDLSGLEEKAQRTQN